MFADIKCIKGKRIFSFISHSRFSSSSP